MNFLKRLFTAFLAVFIITGLLALFPIADDSQKWLFIDGENITRQVNTAVIYRGVESTGQTQWGYDVVVDADGKVTNIISSGLAEGENLAVPENGMVISASGTKTEWLKSNLKVGSKIYYDEYTQRLFVCDTSGKFDPYFTSEISVSGADGQYKIVAIETEASSVYSYDVAVDADGYIIERGSNVSMPEGGFIVSAYSADDRNFLFSQAPLGANCSIAEGKAVFSYSNKNLSKTAQIVCKQAKAEIDIIKEQFPEIDNSVITEIENLISEITQLAKTSYSDVIAKVAELENATKKLLPQGSIGELRGAFHTPDEADINEVRETVKAAKNAGLNTIMLRISNGYGTIVSLPEGDRFENTGLALGFDVLAAYVDICREENITLGIVIDVFYNEYASIAAPEWTSVTSGGERGLADKYYSPASDEFRAYFLNYVKHIVSTYDISNVMLDYIRYPKFSEESDIGYDAATLEKFAEKYKINISEASAIKDLFFESPHWENWVAFKTELITSMAEQTADTIRSVNPNAVITAVSPKDSVDYFYMQEALKWTENGIVDGLCLALYERDSDENDAIPANGYYDNIVADKGEIIGAYTKDSKFFFVGLEAKGLMGGDCIINAIQDSHSIGADGFIFDSLDNYIAQHYYDSLSDSLMSDEAVSPLADTAYAMKELLEFSKTKINEYTAFKMIDEQSASAALEKINEAALKLENGPLDYVTSFDLESDIAIIFASSNAKNLVLQEFVTITKLAYLYKNEEVIPPVIPDESSDASDGTDDESLEEESEAEPQESSNDSLPEIPNNQGSSIDMGSVLIYGFVGVSFAAAIAAMVIGIRRKKEAKKKSRFSKSQKEEELSQGIED